MLLKRRNPARFAERLRIALWPRRSWLRSGQYVTKRILRITASPHAVAAGVAAGAFTSFTPFMGLHFLLAALLAWLLRGNLIASALGTFVGNPLTFPLIWAVTYSLGQLLLGAPLPSDDVAPPIGSAMADILSSLFAGDWATASTAFHAIWDPVLWPMLVGGTLLGLCVAVPLYVIVRRGAVIFRENRRNKLMEKAQAIRERAKALAAPKGANA